MTAPHGHDPARTGQASATVELLLPPRISVNATRGQHWSKTLRLRRRLTAMLSELLVAAEVPMPIPGDRVHATAVLTFPLDRRRDEGNYRAELEKALGDTLAPPPPKGLPAGAIVALERRWLSDDTPEHFTFGTVTFEHQPGAIPIARITLEWTPGP